MRTFRVLAASLMSLAIIFTGTTAANSLQPADHEVDHKSVWIRGERVATSNWTKCWGTNERPVLYAKVKGRYKPIARGTLKAPVEGCKKKGYYKVDYEFTLKNGGNGKKLIMRSGWAGGEVSMKKSDKETRTVFSSVAQEEQALKKFAEALKEVLTGDGY